MFHNIWSRARSLRVQGMLLRALMRVKLVKFGLARVAVDM